MRIPERDVICNHHSISKKCVCVCERERERKMTKYGLSTSLKMRGKAKYMFLGARPSSCRLPR